MGRVRLDYTAKIMNTLNSFKKVVDQNAGKQKINFTTFAQNKGLRSHEIKAIFKLKFISTPKKGEYIIHYEEIDKRQAKRIDKLAAKYQEEFQIRLRSRRANKIDVTQTEIITPCAAHDSQEEEVAVCPPPVIEEQQQQRKKSFSILWGMIKFEY